LTDLSTMSRDIASVRWLMRGLPTQRCSPWCGTAGQDRWDRVSHADPRDFPRYCERNYQEFCRGVGSEDTPPGDTSTAVRCTSCLRRGGSSRRVSTAARAVSEGADGAAPYRATVRRRATGRQ
jgi:hypothetical protein